MTKRTTAELRLVAQRLIQENNLKAEGTDVIAAWLNPIPMTLHRTSKFTVLGDLWLALTILILGKILASGILTLWLVSAYASIFLYWFLFRTYYDLRYFKAERMILMPPNLGDMVLLHELLHVDVGHIEPMTTSRRILAMSPIGPFLFWPRAYRLDYGQEGITREMTKRGFKNPTAKEVLTYGLLIFILFVSLVPLGLALFLAS